MIPSKVLAQSVRDVFAPYPQALAGKEGGVHKVRIAARRLRVALTIIAPKPHGKRRRRADRLLDEIVEAIGITRDLDVGVELLSKESPRRKSDQAAWNQIRRSLTGTRARARRRSMDQLLDLDIAQLRADLRAIAAQDPIDPPQCFFRMTEMLETDGEDLLARLRAVGRRFDPEALHVVRRRARRLRYVIEVTDRLADRKSDVPKRLQDIQGEIGEIHDRHVFAAWLASRLIESHQPQFAARARAARLLRARIVREARRLHLEFLATNPLQRIETALSDAQQSVHPGPSLKALSLGE